ncbi:MAG: HAD family hydrolase, partial [Elusimicrobia bacterium]|nr:HAD family hydrolase [Elusimicrobiota bacterium]
ARAAEAVRAEYERRGDRRTRPYPGVTDLLAALEAHGTPAAVVTNKPEEFARRIAAGLLGRFRFAAVVGARPGLRLKPDPAGALEAARAMGLAPAEVLYLGDTATDMRTAVAAGMEPAGVLWGFRGRAELEGAGARHLLARPHDAVVLLD